MISQVFGIKIFPSHMDPIVIGYRAVGAFILVNVLLWTARVTPRGVWTVATVIEGRLT